MVKYRERTVHNIRLWKQNFIDFPSILVITDKKVKTNNKFDIKVSKLDLSDLKL